MWFKDIFEVENSIKAFSFHDFISVIPVKDEKYLKLLELSEFNFRTTVLPYLIVRWKVR